MAWPPVTSKSGFIPLEMRGSLLQPDIVFSLDYIEFLLRKTPLPPEKRLMLTILEDAIGCFRKHIFAHDREAKRLFRKAEAWILEEGSDWPFSFQNISESLGIDPSYLREGLLRWKEKRLGERPRAKVLHLGAERRRKKPRMKSCRRKKHRLVRYGSH